MTEKIAIFFDSENVSAKHVPAILAKVQSYGDIAIQRAYADWSMPNTKTWREVLSKQPVTPVQQFHHGEEQAIDKVIMMDAIQIAVERNDIGTFCLVTSDKGFSALALKLRELGRHVIGIGEKAKAQIGSLLVNACNEYLYVEDLKPVVTDILSQENGEDTIANFSLSNFLLQAFESTPQQNDGYIFEAQFGDSIRRFKPDFNSRDYGYPSLHKMIEAFPDEYEIMSDGKTPPSYMIRHIETEIEQKEITGRIKRVIENYGIIETDLGDFFYYEGDIKPEYRHVAPTKGMTARFIAVKMPNPSAATSRERNGKADEIELDIN